MMSWYKKEVIKLAKHWLQFRIQKHLTNFLIYTSQICLKQLHSTHSSVENNQTNISTTDQLFMPGISFYLYSKYVCLLPFIHWIKISKKCTGVWCMYSLSLCVFKGILILSKACTQSAMVYVSKCIEYEWSSCSVLTLLTVNLFIRYVVCKFALRLVLFDIYVLSSHNLILRKLLSSLFVC